MLFFGVCDDDIRADDKQTNLFKFNTTHKQPFCKKILNKIQCFWQFLLSSRCIPKHLKHFKFPKLPRVAPQNRAAQQNGGKMKRFFVVFSLILFSLFLFAEEDDDEKLKLAVMEFEDSSGKLQAKTLSDATEYVRGKLVSSNKYVVIAKERQEKAIIKEMKKESYKLCNDKNCQIPLGQALSADTILRTTISFFGGTYTITSELIDLAKEATVKGATESFNGEEKELKNALDSIVSQLVSDSKPQPIYTQQTPIPAPEPVYTPSRPAVQLTPEQKSCNNARKLNVIETWEEYLKNFPDGKCVSEAKSSIEKIKKLAGRWSKPAPYPMTWKEAAEYCSDLNEGGFSDWRLPNIDELRTLIANCSRTETGGSCRINAKRGKISTKDWNSYDCGKCGSGGGYSELSDRGVFWSSTTVPDAKKYVWRVDFDSGRIGYDINDYKGNTRCTR